jgi:hypothetical protein
MKNPIFTVVLLVFSLSLFSQKITPNTYSRHDDYMQRSRKKQTAGIIFLSSGAALTAGGTALIIDGVNRNKRSGSGYDELSTGEVEAVIGGLVAFIGLGAMCGSIPFFVGAHRSRVKAMSLSLKTENAPQLYKSSFSRQPYPALAFRIPLGK